MMNIKKWVLLVMIAVGQVPLSLHSATEEFAESLPGDVGADFESAKAAYENALKSNCGQSELDAFNNALREDDSRYWDNETGYFSFFESYFKPLLKREVATAFEQLLGEDQDWGSTCIDCEFENYLLFVVKPDLLEKYIADNVAGLLEPSKFLLRGEDLKKFKKFLYRDVMLSDEYKELLSYWYKYRNSGFNMAEVLKANGLSVSDIETCLDYISSMPSIGTKDIQVLSLEKQKKADFLYSKLRNISRPNLILATDDVVGGKERRYMAAAKLVFNNSYDDLCESARDVIKRNIDSIIPETLAKDIFDGIVSGTVDVNAYKEIRSLTRDPWSRDLYRGLYSIAQRNRLNAIVKLHPECETAIEKVNNDLDYFSDIDCFNAALIPSSITGKVIDEFLSDKLSPEAFYGMIKFVSGFNVGREQKILALLAKKDFAETDESEIFSLLSHENFGEEGGSGDDTAPEDVGASLATNEAAAKLELRCNAAAMFYFEKKYEDLCGKVRKFISTEEFIDLLMPPEINTEHS